MAYSVQADLENSAGTAQNLIDLCDRAGAGSLDAAALVIMNAAIARADALINSYARHRNTVPYSPVPDIIKYKSSDEAVYILSTDRHAVGATDRNEKRHEELMTWLLDLSEGRVSVGEDPLPAKSGHVDPVTVSNRESIGDDQMSRGRAKGFI